VAPVPGVVLPLAADTNRITLDDGQLQEVATYIMSLDAAGGAPLNQVETAARAQQELSRPPSVRVTASPSSQWRRGTHRASAECTRQARRLSNMYSTIAETSDSFDETESTPAVHVP
jgi:hypothetical protein